MVDHAALTAWAMYPVGFLRRAPPRWKRLRGLGGLVAQRRPGRDRGDLLHAARARDEDGGALSDEICAESLNADGFHATTAAP